MSVKARLEECRTQDGSAVIIVMMFLFVLLALGMALFMLIQSSTRDVALERKDVKAFNVAEAGVDAGLAALRVSWPRYATDPAAVVDPAAFRNNHFPNVTQFPEPKTGQFITVAMYDDTSGNPTTDIAAAVTYDANQNDQMWIESEADVDDARHRILVLAERLSAQIGIPDVALVANKAGGNGQGLRVDVDPNYGVENVPDGGAKVVYTGKGSFNKDVNPGAGIQLDLRSDDDNYNPFDDYMTPIMLDLLRDMADSAGTLFTDDNADGAGAAANASEFLESANAPGSIVYVETLADPVEIGGNTQMGTPDKPVLLVLDAPNASEGIDWRGTSDFFGSVIVVGDVLLRGTNGIFGNVLSNGAVENKGGPGISYNGDIIRRLNEQNTRSTALVPNTWEEYTLAVGATPTTTP